VKPQIIRIAPPAELLTPTIEPESEIRTNEEMLNLLFDMRSALRECNADKRAVSEWAQAKE
jgi:hypothetical protein